MKKIFLIAILSMALVNCSSDDNNTAQDDFIPQNIDFETIGKGQITTIINAEEQQNNIVITNESDWNQLVGELFFRMEESPDLGAEELPAEIDFNTFQVIVSVDEVRPSLSNWLEITNIIENEENITVTILKEWDDFGFQALCQPYHIVKIPKSDKPVVFE